MARSSVCFFCVIAGTLFFVVDLQNIPGLRGMPGEAAPFGTLIWFAGIFELMTGIALVLGAWARLASAFGVIMVIIAYIPGHALPSGWNPTTNLCMPAIVHGLAFLAIAAYGAKKLSFEQAILWERILLM